MRAKARRDVIVLILIGLLGCIAEACVDREQTAATAAKEAGR